MSVLSPLASNSCGGSHFVRDSAHKTVSLKDLVKVFGVNWEKRVVEKGTGATYPYGYIFMAYYNHGQKSLGQSERNFNSVRFTSSVAESSAVFLLIHVPSPLTTLYNVERSKELCLDDFNTVCGVGEGVGTYRVSSASIQFRVC